MKIALQIASQGNIQYLPYLFRSLQMQKFRDWEILLINNGCEKDTTAALERVVRESKLPIKIFRSETNLGFAGGHNFLFRQSDAEYVQILNDDAILDPNYLGTLVDFLDRHPLHASVSGRICRWDWFRRKDSDLGRSDIIDSLGLVVKPWGTVRDLFANRRASELNLPDSPQETFGVSGCLPMYRRIAALAVSQDGLLFDDTYTSYKEDVDLSFRLQAFGYLSATVHAARAWHRRSHADTHAAPNFSASFHSYRNHLWTDIVHLGQTPLLSAPAVIAYELTKALWLLVTNPAIPIRAWSDTWVHRRRLRIKRRYVKNLRRLATITPNSHKEECDVAILMATYNAISDDCLASIAEAITHSHRRVKVVVADNASPNLNAAAAYWKHLPDAIVIQRDGNYGFGHSTNRAAKEVTAKHYFICNPDTKLADPDVIDKCIDYLEAHPEIGILAPKLTNPGTHITQETFRRWPTWLQPIISRTRLGETRFGRTFIDRFHYRELNTNAAQDVDWVQGSAMFIPARVWRDIRGFDERYWMYFEDVDICRTAWEKGWHVTWWPGTWIEHAHARATAKIKNVIGNIIKVKLTREHILSFLKYMWKWRGRRLPDKRQVREAREGKPLVAIIIPVWYGKGLEDELNRCLESLASNGYPRDRMLLVLAEDKSPHGSLQEVIERKWLTRVGKDLPEIISTVADSNLGFAGINNVGWQAVRDRNPDYVFLLNQDTEVKPDFLEQAVERAENDPRIGILQSLLVYGQDRRRVNSVGNALHFLGYGYCIGNGWNRQQAENHLNSERRTNPNLEIAYSSGAACLIRRKVIDEVGLFESEFFMYHEDVDLSLKARLNGWRVAIEPKSIVFHYYEFSKSITKFYRMERNRYLVLLSRFRIGTLLVILPGLIAAEAFSLLTASRGGWLKEKLRSLDFLFSADCRRMVDKLRRETIKIRRVPDRIILQKATSEIMFQDTEELEGSKFMRLIANPLMALYWKVAYFLIRF